jgi:hypothetical protein
MPERKHVNPPRVFTVVEPIAYSRQQKSPHAAEPDVRRGRTKTRLNADEADGACKLVADCEGCGGTILAPPRVSRFDLGGRGSPE